MGGDFLDGIPDALVLDLIGPDHESGRNRAVQRHLACSQIVVDDRLDDVFGRGALFRPIGAQLLKVAVLQALGKVSAKTRCHPAVNSNIITQIAVKKPSPHRVSPMAGVATSSDFRLGQSRGAYCPSNTFHWLALSRGLKDAPIKSRRAAGQSRRQSRRNLCMAQELRYVLPGLTVGTTIKPCFDLSGRWYCHFQPPRLLFNDN